MAEVLLSEAEKTFIVHGIQDNLRTDGRRCEDFRYIEIETNLISNAAGSARVRLANTDILVGIKAEIGRPLIDRPNEGHLEFFLDCSANATPAFEGRGGESLATTIITMLSTAYDFEECLNLPSLCLLPKEKCWILHIDILLLECGGNLFDTVSLAVKAALHNTRIPNVTVGCDEQGSVELELSDDPSDCHPIDIRNVPCLLTVTKVGNCHIVDATMEEETCALTSFVMGIREDGIVTTLKKYGSTSLTLKSITSMTQMGSRVGQAINKKLMQILEEEEKRNKSLSVEGRREQQISGFLR